MKVAVNLTWLEPGRVGGSEEYLTRQLDGLDVAALDVEVFAHPDFTAAHPGLADKVKVTSMPFAAGGRAARIALEHSWLALHARGSDVVHHGGGTTPLYGPRPQVLTVHDLQYRVFPEYFSRSRRAYLELMLPRSARTAAVVAVPSEFVRGEVIDAFGVEPGRVVVVPHGVPDLRVPGDDAVADARRRFGLGDRPFVVYPAITHPHKAHHVLIDAIDQLDDVAMVLLGGSGSAEHDLARRIGASVHRDRIIRTGRVTSDDRDTLIAAADVLAFPSEFEGFGAPVVEAMALGTPVVASNASALAEVVGDAGIVVADPTGEAWSAAIVEARRRSEALVAAGRRRRQTYTTAASGRALAAAYRQAAS